MRLLAVGLLCVLFVGCGGTEPDPVSEPDSIPAPVQEEGPLDADEQRFVDFMRERIPGSASKSDNELIEGGQDLCDELDGKSQEQLGQVATILGFDTQEFADALVASVNTFCPEYRHLTE